MWNLKQWPYVQMNGLYCHQIWFCSVHASSELVGSVLKNRKNRGFRLGKSHSCGLIDFAKILVQSLTT